MSQMPDFVGEAVPDDTATVEIRKKADELYHLMVRHETLKKALEETSEKMLELKHKVLPELLAKAGVDRIGLPDANADLVEKAYYKASISSEWDDERKAAAFDYLESIGHGGLARTVVSVSFGKGEDDKAKELQNVIRQWSNEYTPDVNKTVPWNTLTAFVKEQYEADPPQPLELQTIGAVVGRIAEIKPRKAKKK